MVGPARTLPPHSRHSRERVEKIRGGSWPPEPYRAASRVVNALSSIIRPTGSAHGAANPSRTRKRIEGYIPSERRRPRPPFPDRLTGRAPNLRRTPARCAGFLRPTFRPTGSREPTRCPRAAPVDAPAPSGRRAPSSPTSSPSSGPGPNPLPTPGRDDVTRFLCAGAHLDAAFADAAIAEYLVEHTRALPPSLGVNTVAVLREAVAARARRRVRDGLLVGATALFTLLCFPVAIFWLFAAFGVEIVGHRPRLPGASGGGRPRSAGRCDAFPGLHRRAGTCSP